MGDLGRHNDNADLILPHEAEDGIRVVYINGDLKAGGNSVVQIETNGGLVIIDGNLDFTGKELNIDGIMYTTDGIKIHGSSVSISGALWSEKDIELKGTVDAFSYNPLDIALGPQEETFSIKMVR